MTKPKNLAEKAVWNAIRTIYKLIATPESQAILELLLKNKKMRSTELMIKAELSESQFHPLMKQLVRYMIIDRSVSPEDRGVSYTISHFGENVLELSDPLLKEVRKALPQQQLVHK